MTESEQRVLIQTEQRSKANGHRIDDIEKDIEDIKKEQKAIYEIATSVGVIAERMKYIERKIDDTNQQVCAQTEALNKAEKRLSDRVEEVEHKPNELLAKNVNSVKVAIMTTICTAVASGLVAAVVSALR